jgi:hypothetical protein
MILLGYPNYSLALFDRLEDVFSNFSKVIGEETHTYWKNAIRKGLTLRAVRKYPNTDEAIHPFGFTRAQLISEIENETDNGKSFIAVAGLIRQTMMNDSNLVERIIADKLKLKKVDLI